MDVYATPCNGIVECFDKSDESNCTRSNLTKYFFIGFSLAIIIFYFSLKIFQLYQELNIEVALNMNSSLENPPIEMYEAFHDDPEIINEVNIYLIRRILTKRVDNIHDDSWS